MVSDTIKGKGKWPECYELFGLAEALARGEVGCTAKLSEARRQVIGWKGCYVVDVPWLDPWMDDGCWLWMLVLSVDLY